MSGLKAYIISLLLFFIVRALPSGKYISFYVLIVTTAITAVISIYIYQFYLVKKSTIIKAKNLENEIFYLGSDEEKQRAIKKKKSILWVVLAMTLIFFLLTIIYGTLALLAITISSVSVTAPIIFLVYGSKNINIKF